LTKKNDIFFNSDKKYFYTILFLIYYYLQVARIYLSGQAVSKSSFTTDEWRAVIGVLVGIHWNTFIVKNKYYNLSYFYSK